MAVVLSDLLEANHVTLELAAQTRDEGLHTVVATMRGDTKVREPDKFLREILVREEVHTTFMGHGVAFPHARTKLVEQIVLGIGRSAAGVPFGDKNELAHLLFVIAVPQRMVNDYLVSVGALARITSETKNRSALMNAATPEEFIEILRAAWLLLE
jgi:mannitol/fructose-specific phosphotransferase system IIA component (Ntr-type)